MFMLTAGVRQRYNNTLVKSMQRQLLISMILMEIMRDISPIHTTIQVILKITRNLINSWRQLVLITPMIFKIQMISD